MIECIVTSWEYFPHVQMSLTSSHSKQNVEYH